MKLPPEPPEETKDLDHLRPIDHAVVALPHTPVYKMHRYFARRPWSVFRELIKHYSNPGSIVLDPFCGGGVTVFEGLATGRKVVGVDFNPMAVFITKMEATVREIGGLDEAFKAIRDMSQQNILKLYQTACPKCGAAAPAAWIEVSVCVRCHECAGKVRLADAQKLGRAKYQCPSCPAHVNPAQSERLQDELTRMKVVCSECQWKGVKVPDSRDFDKAEDIEENWARMVREAGLWYPDVPIPRSIEIHGRVLRRRWFTNFYSFFTGRNLLALSFLWKAISSLNPDELREAFCFSFSSMLFECACRLCHIKSGTVVKPGHHFWPAMVFASNNVWLHFERKFSDLVKGEQAARALLPRGVRLASRYSQLNQSCDALLLCRSSASLPLPNESVDAVITDPPYGDNVNYGELSNFWLAWLPEVAGGRPLVPMESEIVVNSYHGKGINEYREGLRQVFLECYRVLKPGRWMVMSFHNRDFQVWNAIHLAAHDAGFLLAETDGMIYQPGVQAYMTTWHQRAGGSMLGDFILSFQKAEKLPQQSAIDFVEMGKKVEELAAEAVLHHHGASLSMIYMKLIPFLLNNNLLERIGENEVIPYLKNNFYDKDGVWCLKENPAPGLDTYLAEYSRNHYKEEYRYLNFVPVEARLEYLVRRLLYETGSATQDDILNEVYTNLINSNAAEMGEINRVLNRIAVLVTPRKGGRKAWRLKETVEKERLLLAVEEAAKEALGFSEESTHDLVIRRLVEAGAHGGCVAHIGRTEQKKYTDFRKLSHAGGEMLRKLKLPETGLKRVTEIDVLWLKEKAVRAAFEVEKTTTIDSGISRFRELFASLHGLPIAAYLVVPKARESKAKEILGSPANVRDSVARRVRYILFEDLKLEQPSQSIDIEAIAKRVPL